MLAELHAVRCENRNITRRASEKPPMTFKNFKDKKAPEWKIAANLFSQINHPAD